MQSNEHITEELILDGEIFRNMYPIFITLLVSILYSKQSNVDIIRIPQYKWFNLGFQHWLWNQ